MKIIFDIETDGLLDKMTKIHVMSWTVVGSGVVNSTPYLSVMRETLLKASDIIGHNIIGFDLPALEKFGISTTARVIDTLALSWYLEPSKQRHGLDDWGKHVGIVKPKVTDWDNLSYDDYKHRCEEDVKINEQVYLLLDKKLSRLYRSDMDARRLTEYLAFKLRCARDQEQYGWRLDIPKAETIRLQLQRLKENSEKQLSFCLLLFTWNHFKLMFISTNYKETN